MSTRLVVFAACLVLVLAAIPAPAQEPVITSQSEVTLVGCVERELAYRTRIKSPLSSVTATDVVLTGAVPADASGGNVALSGDFSLTGVLESQLLNDVGQRVKVIGFMEDMATHVTSRNETTLRRVFVKVWQPAGACS
jgi:hypothetical protein